MLRLYSHFPVRRKQVPILLMSMSGFCFILSIIRCVYSGSVTYLFLNWNLFLAFVPWAISSWMLAGKSLKKNYLLIFIPAFFWLLFFPNAPYILTDLFHLKSRGGVPVWFDLTLILSFAWTGLSFGFISLQHIESYLTEIFNKSLSRMLTIALLFAGSFGIYLGRFMRWNSWDMFSNPVLLLKDITDRVINPLDHPRTWGVTILFGILLNMIFLTFRYFSSISKKPFN